MSRTSSGIALAFLVAAVMTRPLAAQTTPPDVQDLYARPTLPGYFAIVDSYRAGRTDSAVHAILTWPDAAVDRSVSALEVLRGKVRQCPVRPDEIDAGTLDAAVLLHTDASAEAYLRHDWRTFGFQLESARRLVEIRHSTMAMWAATDAVPGGDCTASPPVSRRDWYLAMATVLQGLWELPAAVTPVGGQQARIPTRVPQKQQVEDLEKWNELAPYLHIVSSYRAGRMDEAVRDVLAWSSVALDDARHEIQDLRGQVVLCRTATPAIDGRTFAGEIEVADLDAAVLLHTDAALRALERNLSSWTEIHLRAAKALYDWTHHLTADWSRDPVDLPRECHPVPELSRRDWHLAVAWSLLGHWEPVLAASFAAVGLESAPADAEMLLAAGTIREALALEGVQHPARRPVWARSTNYVFGRPLALSLDVKENLNGARELYERALLTSPVYIQTHLRLGRVLSQLDLLDAARAELELVAANADAARERYLAELFLARVAEQAADSEAAIRHYGRAIGAWPDSQAARLGLVQVLGRTEGGGSPPQELGEVLSRPWLRPIQSDPWWVYPFGESERGPQLLDELRRRFLIGESNGRRD